MGNVIPFPITRYISRLDLDAAKFEKQQADKFFEFVKEQFTEGFQGKIGDDDSDRKYLNLYIYANDRLEAAKNLFHHIVHEKLRRGK